MATDIAIEDPEAETSGVGEATGKKRASGDKARPSRDQLSSWWFPDLEGPDLSTEVVPGQHAALEMLNDQGIAEIFAEEEDDADDPLEGDGVAETQDSTPADAGQGPSEAVPPVVADTD